MFLLSKTEPQNEDATVVSHTSVASLANTIISVESGSSFSTTGGTSLPALFVENMDASQETRLSLSVHLLSGTHPQYLTVKVVSHGTQVLISCAWPKVLLDTENFLLAFKAHKDDKVGIFPASHRRAVATGTALAALKSDVDHLNNVFVLDLPFEVE